MRIVNTDFKKASVEIHNDSISRFDSLVLNDTVFIYQFLEFRVKHWTNKYFEIETWKETLWLTLKLD